MPQNFNMRPFKTVSAALVAFAVLFTSNVARGETITAFDEQTNRLLGVLREETVEVTLKELTNGAHFIVGMVLAKGGSGRTFYDEGVRERNYYSKDVEILLSNRRVRKALEDLQKMDKKSAAKLLSQNIRDNMAELRPMLQTYMETFSQGKHISSIGFGRLLSEDSGDFHSPISDPNYPPTRFGRKYAVFSYIWLASLLELREVHPAVEEVVEFAREEYRLFNRVKVANAPGEEGDDPGSYSFKENLLADSLYNPSLLVTAALCDPTWNTEKKRALEAKLIQDQGIVDYQARAIEQDKDAREGWLPIVPYDGMLKIRYYKGITDAEFNDFFSE
jgi:hypothetical protein